MKPDLTQVWIALGSNLGDRRFQLQGALRCLEELEGFELIACSTWIETPAEGGPSGQGDFLNGVLSGRTSLSALALLDQLQAIEARFGRERLVHHGPRTLDLDLLLYGQEKIQSERLQVPHPGLEERAFVLLPMAQLAPDLTLPSSGLSVRKRLEQLLGLGANTELESHAH